MGGKKKSKSAITSMETINGIVIKYVQSIQKYDDYQETNEDKINSHGVLLEKTEIEPSIQAAIPKLQDELNTQSVDYPSPDFDIDDFHVLDNLTFDNSCSNQLIKTCNKNSKGIILNKSTPLQSYYQRYNKQVDGYIHFEVAFQKTKNPEIIKMEEIEGYNMYRYSHVHFTTEDFNMENHNGFYFSPWHRELGKLLDQQARQGGVAVSPTFGKIRYFLITKRESSKKPTYKTLFMALKKLYQLVSKHKVTELAFDRTEYSVDGLDWDKVKFMIGYIFKDVNVKLIVCNYKQIRESSTTEQCKITNVSQPVSKIRKGTIIVYLASEDGYITDEIEDLNLKFNFLQEFKKSPKTLGTHILTSVNRKKHVLFGCVARKTIKDDVCYEYLERCIVELQNKHKRYKHVGFQAIKDKDPLINNKIVNILSNVLKNVNIYVCWTGTAANK